MEELLKVLPTLGVSGTTIAVAFLVIKYVLPEVFSAIKARMANSNAETKMLSVMQAELEGYRRRENEFRIALDELPRIKAQLDIANDKIEAANSKIAEQSELIKRQSQQIRELTAEIHMLKGLK